MVYGFKNNTHLCMTLFQSINYGFLVAVDLKSGDLHSGKICQTKLDENRFVPFFKQVCLPDFAKILPKE
jgi:hypothetical protein